MAKAKEKETVADKMALIAEFQAKREPAGILPFLEERENLPIRLLAARALAAIGDSAALEALGNLIAVPVTGLSEDVLGHFSKQAGANAARVIARGLAAENPIWRSQILETLAKRAESVIFNLLLPACRDKSKAIRQQALRLLHRLLTEAPERATGLTPERLDPVFDELEITETMGMLREGPISLRKAAIRRLGKVGTPLAFLALAETFAEETGELAEAALQTIEQAKHSPPDFFQALTGHPEAGVRRRSLAALIHRLGPGARETLESALDDADAEVREFALRQFGALFGDEVLSHAAAFASDPSPAVRAAALEAITRWPAPETTEILRECFHDEDDKVRWRALLALAQRGVMDAELEHAYTKVLKDLACREDLNSEEIEGLCAVADCVAQHGGGKAKDVMESFIAAAKSGSLRLRRVAVEAIQRFPPGPRLAAYAQLTDTLDKSILKIVGASLGEAGDRRGIVPLIRIVDECGGRPGDQARLMLDKYPQLKDVDFLIKNLKNRWMAVRRFSADHLRDVKDPRVIPPLLEAFADSDVELQFAAILALQKHATEPRVLEKLIAAVEYGDLTVRQMAAETLGAQKVTAAVPVLIAALSNPFLKRIAEKALLDIGDRKAWLAVHRRRIRDMYFKQIIEAQKALIERLNKRKKKKKEDEKTQVVQKARLNVE
jgi:HEAT repeat protein